MDDQSRVTSVPHNYPIWKTITLGRYNTGDEYINSILAQNMLVPRRAHSIIRNLTLEGKQDKTQLIAVHAEDLGLRGDASLWEIRDRGLQIGFNLCKQEVALALRDQYPDQPEGETIWPVTKTIIDRGEKGILCVVNERKRGMGIVFGCGDGCWAGRMRLKTMSPETQVKLVPQCICECPWSRGKIRALFERA